MKRPYLRDEIRQHAQVEGSAALNGTINRAISEIFIGITSQNRYPECYTLGTQLNIFANGIVELPSDLQHFDSSEVYYYSDGGIQLTDRTRLNPYARFLCQNIGRASQWRLFGGPSAADADIYVKKLNITPYQDIDITNDLIVISYWKSLPFDDDVSDFPINSILEYLALRVASRIARASDFRLVQQLNSEARTAWNNLRASADAQ